MHKINHVSCNINKWTTSKTMLCVAAVRNCNLQINKILIYAKLKNERQHLPSCRAHIIINY